jgi:hypothetical protein
VLLKNLTIAEAFHCILEQSIILI